MKTERSEPLMQERTSSSFSSILKRPRLLAAVAALVLPLVVLIAACGGDDTSSDAAATDSTPVETIDTSEDLAPEADPADDVTTDEASTETVSNADLPLVTVKGKALKKGMKSKRVKQLQNALIYLAYLEADSNDGAFGQKTKKAVQEFQLELALNGDGVAGQKTLRQINKAVKAAPVGGVVVVATGDAATDDANADAK
jgi:peptidoglycan hydrolase-like protein with peptidoglycan-binding domain